MRRIPVPEDPPAAERRPPVPRIPAFDTIATHASDHYRRTGIFAWLFARAKLRGDPVYRALWSLHPRGAAETVLDIGCGQGLSLALLVAARAFTAIQPAGAPSAAKPRFIGIETRPRVAAVAREALAGHAEILTADARSQPLPLAHTVLLFDVAHMMPAAAQDALLDAIVAALAPGGQLLLREADARAGWRFHAVSLGNRFIAFLRRGSVRGFQFRAATEWRACLEYRGLHVETRPTGAGTPFANILFVATKPHSSGYGRQCTASP